MLMPRNDTEDTSQEVIARGLSLAGVSAEVPNSEGMVRYDVFISFSIRILYDNDLSHFAYVISSNYQIIIK